MVKRIPNARTFKSSRIFTNTSSFKLMVIFLFFVLFCISPVISSSSYFISLMTFVNIFIVYAISWDILGGYTGQGSLGQSFLFGIGAYTSALLNLYFRLPVFVTVPVGACMTLLLGLIVALPCLRLRGAYLSLGTLVFPIILTGLISTFGEITGGEFGTSRIGPVDLLAPSKLLVYYYTLIVMVAIVLLMWKLVHSKIGLFFQAIREDEIVARALGIDTTKYKLLSFGISSILAGLAGGIYPHITRGVDPSVVSLSFSIQPITWTVFGGVASIYGAIGGVIILYPIFQYFRAIPGIPPQLTDVLQAILLIIVLLFIPKGILVFMNDKIKKLEHALKKE